MFNNDNVCTLHILIFTGFSSHSVFNESLVILVQGQVNISISSAHNCNIIFVLFSFCTSQCGGGSSVKCTYLHVFGSEKTQQRGRYSPVKSCVALRAKSKCIVKLSVLRHHFTSVAGVLHVYTC